MHSLPPSKQRFTAYIKQMIDGECDMIKQIGGVKERVRLVLDRNSNRPCISVTSRNIVVNKAMISLWNVPRILHYARRTEIRHWLVSDNSFKAMARTAYRLYNKSQSSPAPQITSDDLHYDRIKLAFQFSIHYPDNAMMFYKLSLSCMA